MHAAFVLSLLASVATAVPTTSTEALNVARSIVARAPPEAKAVLKSVASSGTGCAPNSAGFVYGDNAAVIFDNMVVHTEDPAEANKNCKITIDIGLDSKWRYTINKQSVVKGYTDGATAAFKAVYTVGGKTSSSEGAITPNPSGGVYTLNLKQDGAISAYGGGVATVDISLALNREPNTTGYLTVDSMDIIFDYSQ